MRRRFLGLAGTVLAGAVAGCSGVGGDERTTFGIDEDAGTVSGDGTATTAASTPPGSTATATAGQTTGSGADGSTTGGETDGTTARDPPDGGSPDGGTPRGAASTEECAEGEVGVAELVATEPVGKQVLTGGYVGFYAVRGREIQSVLLSSAPFTGEGADPDAPTVQVTLADPLRDEDFGGAADETVCGLFRGTVVRDPGAESEIALEDATLVE